MLILALDTTTRGGSLAIVRDGRAVEVFAGDAGRTHAVRLPGDILDCLARHGLGLDSIELYGVAAGPGSFTGLRIGIATAQGLAFAHRRMVVGVSALDALAEAGGFASAGDAGTLRAAWIDAQRGEVFASLYRRDAEGWHSLEGPLVGKPSDVLAGWEVALGGRDVEFIGDGALAYESELELSLGRRARVIRPAPLLAAAVAAIAEREAVAGRAGPPSGLRPIYVRRPDAELARERGARRAP